MGFIYRIQVYNLDGGIEQQFKIGCTENPLSRFDQYIGYNGYKNIKMDIIEIVDTLTTKNINVYRLKKKYNTGKLYEIAEKRLHETYKGRVAVKNIINNNKRETEWFIPVPYKVPEIADIIHILKDYGIDSKFIETLSSNDISTSNYLKSFLKPVNTKKKTSSSLNYKIDEQLEAQLKEQYLDNPLDFIKFEILNGVECRSIQVELYNLVSTIFIETDPGKLRCGLDRLKRGLIKWPTGTGKRVGILIMIVLFYHYFKNISSKTSKFRIGIISKQNNIFANKAILDYNKLQLLGINVVDATNGTIRKQKTKIKQNNHNVFITTHSACTTNTDGGDGGNININLQELDIDLLIYDEAHNITGTKFMENINDIPYIIGFSAFPNTDNLEQNQKMIDIFNNNIISELSYTEAIQNKWINPYEYHIYLFSEEETVCNEIKYVIEKRKRKNMWKTRKFIIWVPEDKETKNKWYQYLIDNCKEWIIYDDNSIEQFENENETKIGIKCLVCCRKCTEGYDGTGIEFGVNIGCSQINSFIQRQGRSQRPDYDGQLSEFLIFIDGENVSIKLEKINKIEKGLAINMGSEEHIYRHTSPSLSICDYDSDPILNKIEKEAEERRKSYELLKKTFEEQERKDIEARIKRRNEIEIERYKIENSNFTKLVINKKMELTTEDNKIEIYKNMVAFNRDNNVTDKDDYKKLDFIINTPDLLTPPTFFKKIWKGWHDYLGLDKPKMSTITKQQLENKIESIKKEIPNNKLLDTETIILNKLKESNYPYFDLEYLYKDPDILRKYIVNNRTNRRRRCGTKK
jgi:hypothetical protein